MPHLKKYTGNYIEVAQQLGLHMLYEIQRTMKEYSANIAVDLERTAYLSYTDSVVTIQERLKNTTGLTAENCSYAQGNFDARGLTGLYAAQTLAAQHEKTETRDLSENVSVAYTDDKNQLCGFSLVFIRDDSDTTIPENQRKHHFIAAIIKNTIAPPADREVTVFADPFIVDNEEVLKQFLPTPMLQKQSEISEQNLLTEIKKITGSKHLNQLLDKLFENGTFSPSNFDQLNFRIVAGRNIDNRDVRKTQFDGYLAWIKTHMNEEEQTTLTAIETSINNDIDYFTHANLIKNFQNLWQTINEFIDTLPNQYTVRLKKINELMYFAIISEIHAELIQYDQEQVNACSRYTENAKNYRKLAETMNSLLVQKRNQRLKDNLLLLQELIKPLEILAVLKGELTEKITTLLDTDQKDLLNYSRIDTFPKLVQKLTDEVLQQQKDQLQQKINKYIPISDEPNKPKSFIPRNRTTLVVGFVSLLLAIGLIATGVLAPVGAIIAIGLFVAAGVATITTLGAVIKIANDKPQFNKIIEEYNKEKEQYDQNVNEKRDIEQQCNGNTLKEEFDAAALLINQKYDQKKLSSEEDNPSNMKSPTHMRRTSSSPGFFGTMTNKIKNDQDQDQDLGSSPRSRSKSS